MSAGLAWNEQIPYTDPKNDEIAMDRSGDRNRYVLSRPIVAAPGTVWEYSGGATQLLGAILEKATKQSLVDYARARLFAPLGIQEFEWLGQGGPAAASGLRLRPRDLAKFASLYLHEGQWNGQQVVPQTWVRESTRRQISFPGSASGGYGYQWWHACLTTPSGIVEVPSAVGNGTQRIFLLRAHRTAVTVLAGRYNDFSADPARGLLLDFLQPALPPAAASPCPS
jgi:CubicO group peptidase (beta-lactamase class C family)